MVQDQEHPYMALNYMHRTCHKAKHYASSMLQYTKSTLNLLFKKKSITTSAEAGFVSISSYFNTFTMCLSILHATT